MEKYSPVFIPYYGELDFSKSSISVFLAFSLVALTCFKIQNYWHQARRSYPILQASRSQELKSLIKKQFVKDPNQIYIVKTPFRKLYVLPNRYVREYGWLPEHKVSSNVDLHERLMGKYTLLGSQHPETPGDRSYGAISYTKGLLTKNAARILPIVRDELEFAIASEIGHCADWTAFQLHPLAATLNLRTYVRVFVGPKLSHNPEWMETCLRYSAATIATAATLSKYPSFLLPLVANFVPQLRDLRKEFKNMVSFLRPIHEERLKAMHLPGFSPPDDFIQWYTECSGENGADTTHLTESLLQINFAGIQSTAMVLTQALFDLANHPECIPKLREEIENALEAENDHELTTASLTKLHLMDSFFKESQRFNHANVLSVYRKIIQPLQLSNGTILPANSYVAIPGSVYATTNSSGERKTFDPFQWAKKRKEVDDNKYLYVSATPEAVEFGYGAHACPGRFFATNVLKVALSKLLLKYDFKLKDRTERPKFRYNNVLVMIPNVTAELEFRSRA